jgi:hypothetical protein
MQLSGVSAEQLARGSVMLSHPTPARKALISLARIREVPVNGQQHSSSFGSRWCNLEVVVEEWMTGVAPSLRPDCARRRESLASSVSVRSKTTTSTQDTTSLRHAMMPGSRITTQHMQEVGVTLTMNLDYPFFNWILAYKLPTISSFS